MMKAAEPVKLVECDDEGLPTLIGKSVMVWCMNYIYAGTLEGVNKTCIKLNPAFVVYETGVLTEKKFKDAQQLPKPAYVNLDAIEMYSERE